MPIQNLRRSPSSPRFLRRVNPFLKIGLSIGLVSLVLAFETLPALLILTGGLLLLLLQVRLQPMAVLYGVSMLLLLGLASAVFIQDAYQAILSMLRLMVLVLPAPILAVSTSPSDLIRAFQAVRLPSFITLSVMLIWRFFPLMQQELQRIWEANQLRGIDLSRQPQHWFSGLLVPLIFQMVTYADDVTIGLQTRGYSPTEPRSIYQPLRWQWLDTFCLSGIVLWFGLAGYAEWSL